MLFHTPFGAGTIHDASEVNAVDLEELDKRLLDEDGYCRVLPAAAFANIPTFNLQLWCIKRAIYQYPTTELIEFLKRHIADRSAIEIGCGRGNIGRHLGIQMTDSGQQTWPKIIAHYNLLGQAVATPPVEAVIMDGNSAVDHFKPEVVIGCWITHKHHGTMGTGNAWGVEEEEIIGKVAKYIHVGNDSSHTQKPALRLPHSKLYHEWLVSRSGTPQGNHALVWENANYTPA